MKKMIILTIILVFLLLMVQCQEPNANIPGKINLRFKIGEFEMLGNLLDIEESQVNLVVNGKELSGDFSNLIYNGWEWGEEQLPLNLEHFSISLKATLVFTNNETQLSTTVSFANMEAEHWFYENEFATGTLLEDGNDVYFLLDINEGKVLVVENPVRIYGSVKEGGIVSMDIGDRFLKAVGDIFGNFQFWVPRPYIGEYDVTIQYGDDSTMVTVEGESDEIEISF